MASIMIFSFSMIYVKNNGLLMPVLCSWAKNETGFICWTSVMVVVVVRLSVHVHFNMGLSPRDS